MAIFKCKMCGGTLEVNNETVAICEYCGTKQTLPKLDDEHKTNLYDRANHFRRSNEFDKAAGIYEQILNYDNTDSESYWSLVLCRYGIEYVEDPASRRRIQTVNRAQFTSIFDDEDYKSALRYADGYQREVYEQEATAINEIQKGILAISSQEEPFDVFICYKETDNNGRRTPDSVLANELYHELVREGFKVFFSRITLEDKLGTAYEPYIFAALNSSKVMVVLGTKPEFFNAVWVKNEWSRYLALIRNGARKMLIPAYKDMDPYDLPEEFSHLQAQDMTKLGFMQDIIRGIKKIVEKNTEKKTVKETIVIGDSSGGNLTALLKRGYMALEDGEWSKADEFFEQCLNQNAELPEAYLGKLMAELQVGEKEKLRDLAEPFDSYLNFQKTIRFADEELKTFLIDTVEYIKERNESDRLENIYSSSVDEMNHASTEYHYFSVAEQFESIPGYKDADILAKECREKAETAKLERLYGYASDIMKIESEKSLLDAAKNFELVSGYKDADALAIECRERAKAIVSENIYIDALKEANTEYIPFLESAIEKFNKIIDWKDSASKINECYRKIEAIKYADERKKIEEAEKAERDRIAKESRKKLTKIILLSLAAAICVVIVFVIFLKTVILPPIKYSKAVNLLNEGNYSQALSEFDKLGNYSDSKIKAKELREKVCNRESISAGGNHTVGLKSDGTVVAVGQNDDGECNASEWTDIITISAGGYHTVGLKSDGTVVAVGQNDDRECNVSKWTDIIAISAGDYHTVGLKSDGTVVAVGYDGYGRCDVSKWTDIIAISAGGSHTVGLKLDGTVVAVGSNESGRCDVSKWTDIIAISAGSGHTVGLKSDGTVVAVGYDEYGQCDVSKWTDIIAISAGYEYTVGLKSDGTVVAVGQNDDGECNVAKWTDIIAISAGYDHTVGLKSDGTVVAVGYDKYGQCDVSNWKNIKTPNNQ